VCAYDVWRSTPLGSVDAKLCYRHYMWDVRQYQKECVRVCAYMKEHTSGFRWCQARLPSLNANCQTIQNKKCVCVHIMREGAHLWVPLASYLAIVRLSLLWTPPPSLSSASNHSPSSSSSSSSSNCCERVQERVGVCEFLCRGCSRVEVNMVCVNVCVCVCVCICVCVCVCV